MKKKIIIILVSILIVFILIPFAIERVYHKNGQMHSVKIPMDSFCENKQDSNSIVHTCTYSGGRIIYDEFFEQEKIVFKRELTNNNCFNFNLKDYIILPSQECNINESIITALPNIERDKYTSPCSLSGRYCIEREIIGKETGGSSRGIGLFSSPVNIYGLEIFKIIDKTENNILYREAKVHIGGSSDLTASTYWGDNDNFLLFERDKRLYYLKLK